MTQKVVSLNGEDINAPGEPNEMLVEAIKEVLERAENGEIVGAAVAMTAADNTTPYMLVGEIGGFSMSGALSALKTHVDLQNIEGAEYGPRHET